MTAVRKVIGVLLLVLGVPILTAGIVAAIYVGPDDTAQTGPHRLSTDGVAIVTTPEVLAYVGPTMHLIVESTGDAPLFLGIGPEVDVQSYLGDARHREVTNLDLPWTVTSAETGAATIALAPPGGQTWWLKSSAGPGARTIDWRLPNGRYEIVALNADGSPAVTVNVTLGLEVGGAFYATLAVAALGLLLVLVGLLLLLWRRLRRRPSSHPVAVVATPVPVVSSGAGVAGVAAYDVEPTAPTPVYDRADAPGQHPEPGIATTLAANTDTVDADRDTSTWHPVFGPTPRPPEPR